MPVETPHPEFVRNLPLWQKCRDVVCGEEAVKTAGMTYLPRLSGQDEDEYDAYRARATFYAASSRTVEGLVGVILAKEGELEFPEGSKDLLEHIDGGDNSLGALENKVLTQQFVTGRLGLLVDAPGVDDARPYVATYHAENIVSWQWRVLDGKSQPTQVVLREEYYEQDANDPFVFLRKHQYRVLELEGWDGPEILRRYTVQIWREAKDSSVTSATRKATYVRIAELDTVPTMSGGRPIRFLPFKFVGARGLGEAVEKPLIADLASMNLSHYRNSADHEHGLHWTALPTVFAAGFDTNMKYTVGSARAWITDNAEAKAGYLEFSGAGLDSIAKAMESKEKKMAVLGARLLEDHPASGAETATAVRIRKGGENSLLRQVAKNASEALTVVLQWVADWAGSGMGEAKRSLNQDFDTLPIDGQTMSALMLALQSGDISYDVWFYNLKRGELLPEGHTLEDEKALITAGRPTPPAGRLTTMNMDDPAEEEDFEA